MIPMGRQGALDAPIMSFPLPKLVAALRAEREWARDGRGARILHKSAQIKVILVVLKAGKTIPAHRTKSTISLQVLDGSLRLSAAGGRQTIAPGSLVTLAPDIPHDLEAAGDCAFLLTMGGTFAHDAEPVWTAET